MSKRWQGWQRSRSTGSSHPELSRDPPARSMSRCPVATPVPGHCPRIHVGVPSRPRSPTTPGISARRTRTPLTRGCSSWRARSRPAQDRRCPMAPAFRALAEGHELSPGLSRSRLGRVDQVLDDEQIGEVVGQQGHVLGHGCRRDHEVGVTTSRVATPLADSRSPSSPCAGDLGCHGQRGESGLDGCEPSDSAGSLVRFRGNQCDEVPLDERRDADRSRHAHHRLVADQN